MSCLSRLHPICILQFLGSCLRFDNKSSATSNSFSGLRFLARCVFFLQRFFLAAAFSFCFTAAVFRCHPSFSSSLLRMLRRTSPSKCRSFFCSRCLLFFFHFVSHFSLQLHHLCFSCKMASLHLFLSFFLLHALSKSLPSLDSFRRLIPTSRLISLCDEFFLPATFPCIFDLCCDVLIFAVLERTTLTCSHRYLSIYCAFVVSSTEIDARGLPCLVRTQYLMYSSILGEIFPQPSMDGDIFIFLPLNFLL